MKIIATQVELKIKLHKCLEFRNEEKSQVDRFKNILVRVMGNVTSDSEITFEYRLKAMKELL